MLFAVAQGAAFHQFLLVAVGQRAPDVIQYVVHKSRQYYYSFQNLVMRVIDRTLFRANCYRCVWCLQRRRQLKRAFKSLLIVI